MRPSAPGFIRTILGTSMKWLLISPPPASGLGEGFAAGYEGPKPRIPHLLSLKLCPPTVPARDRAPRCRIGRGIFAEHTQQKWNGGQHSDRQQSPAGAFSFGIVQFVGKDQSDASPQGDSRASDHGNFRYGQAPLF